MSADPRATSSLLPPAATTTPVPRETASRDAVLAGNLLVARVAAGLTQQQLADAADVSRATVAQIEAGLSDPRLSTIVDLAHAVGVSPVVLLSGERELAAIEALARRPAAPTPALPVSPEQLRQLSLWAASGLIRDRVRAARLGAEALRASGETRPAIVGGAIGSAMRPGDGMASAALFAELSSDAVRP